MTTSSSPTTSNGSDRPANVGILAMEVYFPSTYVAQSDLEQYNGVSTGKYTIGLGQDAMSFTGDREDINSMALTCVTQLLEKYSIAPTQIGRLEVGTETLVDKSKSTKTVLMSLFEPSGNTDIDGVTTINACYGGTGALLNAIAWVESSAWDGRYAIVVAADIAGYAKGSARPSGGCGAIAMLIGADAPLVIDMKTKATFSSHWWDFYKPTPTSEYPTVNGALSQTCYLHALDRCYQLFCEKNERALGGKDSLFDLSAVDFAVFHSPYNKLVQKSVGRLLFLDACRRIDDQSYETLRKWTSLPLEQTLTDRELDLAARGLAKEIYKTKVDPGCSSSKRLGNCYTASVYMNLATLVDKFTSKLENTNIMLYSYGSGCMAAMFFIRGRSPSSQENTFTLQRMGQVLDLTARLDARTKKSAAEYTIHMALRERFYLNHSAGITQSTEAIVPGAYYLTGVNDKGVRTYARKDKICENVMLKENEVHHDTIVEMNGTKEQQSIQDIPGSVYISGISAGIPGHDRAFEGQQTLDLLLQGENCIEQLTDETIDELLKRNIVTQRRDADGAIACHKIQQRSESIQVAAVMKTVDLVKDYGIPDAMVNAMDEPTQTAVAAGLEAVRDAHLVRGIADKWRLPEEMAATTGIIYATSYPTMNAAVKEAARFGYGGAEFELDRKILFRVLCLANTQLAQIIGARGPNTQTNAACAGTTQALSMAQDWITLGKCERVVVISSDSASSDTLMPWIGGGFRILGASSIAATVQDAARPFDIKRNGMIVGAGAVGLVVESPRAFSLRLSQSNALQLHSTKRVRLLASHFANSAYHGASIDVNDVTEQLVQFLLRVEKELGITKHEIAKQGVYYSHETFTNAGAKLSCAYAEMTALRNAFGDELVTHLLIANTKGFTGHPMAVSFEDVVAVEGLRQSRVPPVVNFETHDPNLGWKLRLATGGPYPHKYALRFAAGFGSQLAFTLYGLEE